MQGTCIYGFKPEHLVKYGLSGDDAVTLALLDVYCTSVTTNNNNETHNTEYCEINYPKLINLLHPFCKNNRKYLRLCKKYANLGLLLHKCIKKGNGASSYIKLTPLFYSIFNRKYNGIYR